MEDFEKLGVFYIGRAYDLAARKAQEDLVLYDSRDLVTHAVVVGMTGSGKTGLCIDLIEEAAIDNVPSILIDPKGDLTNLLLTFPGLSSGEFMPWVNEDDAARKGLSVEDYASQQAGSWQKGLADWGQSGDRIQRLRQAAEFVIYTPGSNAGVPVSILKSFAAPPAEILEDGELLQERITTTVTSLLGLLNIQADPLQSREHILLSTIIGQMWQQGQDLDLATLITQIQKPPVTKIGVLDLESFYPTKERFSLVMALNNLIASPGFSAWLEGVPLDIGEILHNRQGKPRVAIFSIAHLGDAERMFFVSLLLNQVLGWMRTQPGTTSLRALVYMDEIFGFFPPVANPPSKQPLLTLLKQARAFGVGIVLATQNPVDLDYKGLSNTGTWFIGRLQTERDKDRVMEGLEGAAATAGGSFNRQKMEQILAGLGSRIFLMNNTHDDEPVLFTTRWCLSYLRGPLTRSQIKTLMDPYKLAAGDQLSGTSDQRPSAAKPGGWSANTAAATGTAGTAAVGAAAASGAQPTLAPDINQYFIPGRGRAELYTPMLLGAARVRFSDAKAGVDEEQEIVFLTPITDQPIPVDWVAAQEAGFALNDLDRDPARGVAFGELPGMAAKSRNYAEWTKDFASWVYGSQKLELLRSPSTGQVSTARESDRDFRVRLQQAARERRDQAVEALSKKYAPRLAALKERIRKAEQAVDREADQAKSAGMQTALSFGSTILGALLGRKKISSSTVGKAATSMKSASRTAQQKADVDRAKETVKTYKEQFEELSAEFEDETKALEDKIDPSAEELETVPFRPKKTDIDVRLVSLVWAPCEQDERGKLTPCW
jgi:hypothetical protein